MGANLDGLKRDRTNSCSRGLSLATSHVGSALTPQLLWPGMLLKNSCRKPQERSGILVFHRHLAGRCEKRNTGLDEPFIILMIKE